VPWDLPSQSGVTATLHGGHKAQLQQQQLASRLINVIQVNVPVLPGVLFNLFDLFINGHQLTVYFADLRCTAINASEVAASVCTCTSQGS